MKRLTIEEIKHEPIPADEKAFLLMLLKREPSLYVVKEEGRLKVVGIKLKDGSAFQ